MTDLRKAAQMALDWRDKNSELLFELGGWDFIFEINDWSQSIRGALAQPEQEPVAWQWLDTGTFRKNLPATAERSAWNPLYPAPPRREWQGLTDEEVRDLWSWSMTAEAERTANTQQHAFAHAIEAKLKEKNT